MLSVSNCCLKQQDSFNISVFIFCVFKSFYEFNKKEECVRRMMMMMMMQKNSNSTFCDKLIIIIIIIIIQGGSNMTGTDLYVNKPHCAAAVRP